MICRRLLLSLMWFMISCSLYALEAPTISLVTLGPDDPVYVWFGHSSFMVDDPSFSSPIVYDYGVFDFNQDRFFLNFAQGRLIYSKTASSANHQVYAARMQQRDMRILPLNLPADTSRELAAFLEAEVQPERNTYLYHHYEDNCSTRLRDMIDDALDGEFYQWASAQEGRMTYREHFSRHAGSSYPMLWLLNFLQGSVIDKPITRWEEMFLPFELEQAVLDYPGLAGEMVSVTSFGEVRPPVDERYHQPWPWFLAVGVTAALLLALLRRYPRGYGISQAVLGLIFGLLGTGLMAMMWFTDHEVTRGNLNILFVNPLWFLLIPWGISLARGTLQRMGQIMLLWRVLSAAGAAALVIRPFMEHPQGNQLTLALLLPMIIIQARWHRIHVSKTRQYNSFR